MRGSVGAWDGGKRLAYLCNEAPREGRASYVHVHEIIAGLRRRGWQVDLFAPGYSNRAKRPGLAVRLWEALRLQFVLAATILRYDAVYIRDHPLTFIVTVAARFARRPYFQEINGTWKDLYVIYPAAARFRMLFQLRRHEYAAAAGLIVVTPQLRDWIEDLLGAKAPPVRIIPNGANTDLFTPQAVSRLDLPARYVVFFGGLTRWHGVDLMLEALASPSWPEGLFLVVAGEGPMLETLKERAMSEPRLVLLGNQPYGEVAGIVTGAIAGLVPITDPDGRSASSGLAPLKLFETLACGIPAIVSDFPYQADLVRTGDCGLVFAAGDGRDLADKVAELAGDPARARAMGRRGREIVLAKHSWDSRAGDTENFVDRIAFAGAYKEVG